MHAREIAIWRHACTRMHARIPLSKSTVRSREIACMHAASACAHPVAAGSRGSSHAPDHDLVRDLARDLARSQVREVNKYTLQEDAASAADVPRVGLYILQVRSYMRCWRGHFPYTPWHGLPGATTERAPLSRVCRSSCAPAPLSAWLLQDERC